MPLLAVMTAFILVQVRALNDFALGLPWAEELARYAGLGVVCLAVPLLLQDKHIKVDLLLNRLKGGAARTPNVVNELIALGFALPGRSGRPAAQRPGPALQPRTAARHRPRPGQRA